MPIFNPIDNTGMVRYSYINPTIPAGNTITGQALTTPETAFESSFVVPAGGIRAGTVVDIWAAGTFSSAVSALSLTLRLKVAGQTIASINTPLSLLTSNKGWTFDTLSNVLSDGKVESQGQGNFAGTMTPISNTASYTIDSTVDMPVTITAQWGAVGASNSIQLRQLIVSIA